jgi:hypothetical protein
MTATQNQPGFRRPVKAPDFSPRAVSRAVLGETLQKPQVLYPAAIGMLGGVATMVLGPVFLVPAIVGGVIGAGAWAWEYAFRRDMHARNYLQGLHRTLELRVADTLRELTGELRTLKFEPGISQIERLRDKYQVFVELLRRKLDPGEMTFMRYLGMGEQVFLGGLDNLARISDALKGSGTNDTGEIRRRIKELKGDGIDSNAQDQEEAALMARLALMEQQREKISGWLAENEAAMTALDRVMAGVAEMNTTQSATMKMQHAMEELETLAKRASSYSAGK